MKLASIALAVAALSASGAALAVDFTYTGSLTAASPTFNRPLTLTSLSGVGTAAHYSAFTFTVTEGGDYSFLTTATGYDPFLVLYAGTFTPTSALTNVLAVNDDFPVGNLTQSGFTTALTAGTAYALVNTAFSNTGLGTFSTLISRPGIVVPAPIPEPETYALMAVGLAGIGVALRRRSTRSEASALS